MSQLSVQGNSGSVQTDIANAQIPNSTEVGGVITVGADGDYKKDSGAALVRKLLFRRFTTPLGSFFHLPKYGFALSEKEPFSPSDLVKKKAQAEKQALLEPEVIACAVSFSLQSATGVVTMNLQAKTRLGQPVELAIPFAGGKVVL